MSKKWQQNEEGIFQFLVDDIVVGSMEIFWGSANSKAICRIGNLAFLIKRNGAWNTSVDIAELSGETLAIVRTEKWYADHSTLEFEGKVLHCG